MMGENIYFKLKGFIQNIPTKHLIVIFVLLGILALWLDIYSGPNEQKKSHQESVDTYIPAGMTLIPIDIQNIESLRNIMGSFGVVDLYTPSLDGKSPPKKIASSIKIMRAPLNPDVFAVLVKEQDASRIASQSIPYFVTILNPKAQKTQVHRDQQVFKVNIITEM